MRNYLLCALASALLMTPLSAQAASAGTPLNGLQRREGAPEGLVTWTRPRPNEVIAQCKPLVFTYTTPAAPREIEMYYRWKNITYAWSLNKYDPKQVSTYWTDAKTEMVFQVNKFPFPAGSVMWFKITDVQGNISFLQGTGYTVQPSDDDTCITEDFQKEAEGGFGTMTGQGIFTTVTATPTGAASVTATDSALSAPPSSVASASASSAGAASSGGGGTNKAVIGGVVGGVVIVALLAGLAAFFLLRRRKAKRGAVGLAAEEEDKHDGSGAHGLEGGDAGSAMPAPSPWTYTVASQPTETIPAHAPGPYYVQEQDAGYLPDDHEDVTRVPPGYSEATSSTASPAGQAARSSVAESTGPNYKASSQCTTDQA